MSEYLPKPFNSHFGDSIKVKIDLIMQQKQILKIFHTLILQVFALKTNLANLKTEVDKLDIDILVPIPVDLSKLSDVVKMMFFKKLYIINYLQK